MYITTVYAKLATGWILLLIVPEQLQGSYLRSDIDI